MSKATELAGGALDADAIERKFRRLADEWYDEVGDISTSRGKFSHPAYRQILQMGDSVVPFILRELESEEGHWFRALSILTGQNPAVNAPGHDEAVQAWLSWGRQLAALTPDQPT